MFIVVGDSGDALRPILALLLILGVTAGACAASLPDDLPGLVRLMNDNDVPLSWSATNKVADRYGQEGLLWALAEGRPKARGLAARALQWFPSDKVEVVLSERALRERDSWTLVQILMTLGQTGSEKAAVAVRENVDQSDAVVATTAREALRKIEQRLAPGGR